MIRILPRLFARTLSTLVIVLVNVPQRKGVPVRFTRDEGVRALHGACVSRRDDPDRNVARRYPPEHEMKVRGWLADVIEPGVRKQKPNLRFAARMGVWVAIAIDDALDAVLAQAAKANPAP